MRKFFLLGMAVVVAVLSGCGSTNSTTFRSMSAAYRDVVESYSNDNTLINVVRASQKMPVSFLDIPSIMGTGNVSANASLTGTANSLSTMSNTLTPTVGLTVSGGYTFTQSSLDNATFMKPFLSAIQPEIVGYLSANQAAPRSVLYSLVIDSIDVVTDKKDVIASFVNDPSKEDYLSFQRVLYVLVAAGLSVEPTFMKVPQSPVMDEATMRASMGMFTAALASGVTVDEIATPGRPNRYQLVRLVPQFRMCLNRTDGQVLFGDSLAPSMYCTQTFKARAPSRTATELGKLLADFGNQTYKNLSINIKLRSTRNVFDFLGQVVSMQNAEKPTIVKIFNPEALEAKPNSTAEDFPPVPLFIVHKNQRLANTLTALEYRGATYSIPDDSNSFSKEVMVLLSQLLTLNKISGSIPPSPAVLVK
ncbi:hypothetical protein KZZ10_09215 [Alcaligenaceae bacterium LF4-65]|uniref:Lipoprotein n=1 Tax=Zwartia hollandica TaxID=324606 RepID=A0A953T7L7_9BURK|nr:hypothetical protein [Zwartia hollandica]MBZ1350824.1 hypothetical protein [Zwartia hollandica]